MFLFYKINFMGTILLGLGTMELVLILGACLLAIAVAYYGRNTQFGFWGSLLISILCTPLIAFFIISYLNYRIRKQ
jgi:hypothetical protein